MIFSGAIIYKWEFLKVFQDPTQLSACHILLSGIGLTLGTNSPFHNLLPLNGVVYKILSPTQLDYV